ncbi:MAG TPA: suppressor of fused domain protein [Chroococcales cyanobacterium]
MSSKKGRAKKGGAGGKGDRHKKGSSGGFGDLSDGSIIYGAGEFDPVAQRDLLIETWHARNDLYKQMFGEPTQVYPPNYGPPAKLKEVKEIDPNTVNGGSGDPGDPQAEEQHLAILAYGPDPLRPYWTYVTAGVCSPWVQHEPAEVSGFGCELMIKSPVDEAWPAQILRSLAFHIFNHGGVISPGVRIGLNAPIKENSDSLLRNLFVWYADEAPDGWYILPAGGFGIFCVVGITEDECRYAESVDESGTWCIQEVLRYTGTGQVSIPERASVINEENAERLNNARIFANNFNADIAAKNIRFEQE